MKRNLMTFSKHYLGYIGTASSNEKKDDSPFRCTLVGCEPTQSNGLRFRGQRHQLHHGGDATRLLYHDHKNDASIVTTRCQLAIRSDFWCRRCVTALDAHVKKKNMYIYICMCWLTFSSDQGGEITKHT